MQDIDSELSVILAALPPEYVSEDHDRAEYKTLFSFCGLAIQGGIEWPYRDLHAEMAGLRNGFGCWLEGAGRAIDAAQIEDSSRDLWRVSLNGARAVLQILHVENRPT
nr:hypothetical protein [uncultured Shinella sp.]